MAIQVECCDIRIAAKNLGVLFDGLRGQIGQDSLRIIAANVGNDGVNLFVFKSPHHIICARLRVSVEVFFATQSVGRSDDMKPKRFKTMNA